MAATAVVIPNYNGKNVICDAIESALAQSVQTRVILVDDNSDDASLELVKSRFAAQVASGRVVCLQNGANLGVARSLNAGIQYALDNMDPTYILKQDNDAVVEPHALEALQQAMEQDERIAIAGGKVYLDGTNRIQQVGHRVSEFLGIPVVKTFGSAVEDQGQFDTMLDVDITEGCLVLFRSSIFTELGMLDEELSPYGFEDFEFAIRAKKAGYRTVYVPDCVASHRVSDSGQTCPYDRTYYRARNRLLFVRKGYGFRAFLLYGLVLSARLPLEALIRSRSLISLARGHFSALFGLDPAD